MGEVTQVIKQEFLLKPLDAVMEEETKLNDRHKVLEDTLNRLQGEIDSAVFVLMDLMQSWIKGKTPSGPVVVSINMAWFDLLLAIANLELLSTVHVPQRTPEMAHIHEPVHIGPSAPSQVQQQQQPLNKQQKWSE
jgi:hypothetical protein